MEYAEIVARQPLTRILLDTNAWNYLADHADAAALAVAARDGQAAIVVAPAVVYESVAITEIKALHARARLLTDERWERLMPEAYSESQEVLGEVRRLRPEWLLEQPPKGELQRLYRYWRRNGTGFWARVRREPERASTHVRHMQREMLERAREETKSARKGQVGNPYPAWSAPLTKYFTEMPRQVGVSDDEVSVSAWRRDAFHFWTFHLRSINGQPTPLDAADGYVDWLSAELDFGKALKSAASWYQFWLFDVREEAMPRRWLRFSSGLLQQFSGWSRGTPGDNQISTYLMDADRFITADAGLARIVEKLHADAPFPVASPILIGADRAGAIETLNLIAAGGVQG
jgi:hypothetical protein